MIKKRDLFSLLILICLTFNYSALAGIINPDSPQQGWKDPRAYRPSPVLFLHGFGPGTPRSWTEAKVDTILNQYYSKYYTGYNSDPTILSSTRFPYLEIINFGSSLIDRNSSIDTYKIGDRYVLSGQRKAGDPGWFDKLNTAIETLRQYYVNRDSSRQKVILVAHSMGGLAARKYLKSYSYANQKIDKLIMISTPNLGSLLAATAITPYNRNRHWGWFLLPTEWASTVSTIFVDEFLEFTSFVDIHGDAVWDMDPTSTGSGFTRDLNYNYSSLIDHFAIAGKHWLGFNLGDGVVSLKSQLGTGVLSLRDKRIIPTDHWRILNISINDILSFLDSTKPELQITSPDPTKTTEIYVPTINIKGEVYKEYLPADSKLTINIRRQGDGYTLPPQTSLLKPSDLWLPGNPDSPVAEFNEAVHFPGNGTYKITLQAINPAGVKSELKSLSVTVDDLSLRSATIYLSVPTVNIHLVRKIIDRDGEFNFVKDYTRLGWEIHTPPDPMADYYWKTGAFYINQPGIITVGAAYYIPLPGPPPHSLTIRTAEPSCTPCPPDGYRIPTSYYTSEAELNLGICSGMLTGTINLTNADFNIKEPSSTTTCPYVSSSIIGRQEYYRGTYASNRYTGTFQGSRGLTVQMEGVNPDKGNCPVTLYEAIDYNYNGNFIMYLW